MIHVHAVARMTARKLVNDRTKDDEKKSEDQCPLDALLNALVQP